MAALGSLLRAGEQLDQENFYFEPVRPVGQFSVPVPLLGEAARGPL